MRKDEFLKMMWQDNETESEPKKTLYADVIECMDIALSQSPDTFEVPSDRTTADAYAAVEKYAREKKLQSIGPFQSAELIAGYLGTKYERPSKRLEAVKAKVNLEDFL